MGGGLLSHPIGKHGPVIENLFDRSRGERRWPDEPCMAAPDVTPEEVGAPAVSVGADAADPALGEAPVDAWPARSQKELEQLEARARVRMADPKYRRRIQATGALARSIVETQR
jgi:hypothetical protein